MPSATLQLAARAERDGCGCPPWVLRCVHFAGRILWLGDLLPCKICSTAPRHFCVHEGDELERCADCSDIRLWGAHRAFRTASLPEAEAEFWRRDAELRGREVGA